MKLTRNRRLILQMARDFRRPIHVFADMRDDVDAMERDGLLVGNGKRLDRMTAITDAGERALVAQGGGK